MLQMVNLQSTGGAADFTLNAGELSALAAATFNNNPSTGGAPWIGGVGNLQGLITTRYIWMC
jgi:hypothetical protein